MELRLNLLDRRLHYLRHPTKIPDSPPNEKPQFKSYESFSRKPLSLMEMANLLPRSVAFEEVKWNGKLANNQLEAPLERLHLEDVSGSECVERADQPERL